jgi:Spy/CpxP family protein refolding chaperone
MYPGMMRWWAHHQHHGEWRADCGSGGSSWRSDWGSRHAAPPDHGDLGSGAFGVRRPLRFLAFKLDLSDAQVGALARILSELKTERAQAEVDARRTCAAFADAVAGDTFDRQKASDGATLRVGSAEHLRDIVLTALERIHELLEPEQRKRLAYLIRTGTLVF